MDYQAGKYVSRVLDFSDPKDAKKVLDKLGGEDFLKKEYPKVYQSYLKTVAKHKRVKKTEKEAADGLQSGAFAGAISIAASNNKVKKNQLDGTEEGLISGATSVQGHTDWSRAIVSGHMKNLTQDTIIHTFFRKLSNENYYETVQHRDVKDIASFGEQRIQNFIESTAILKEDGTMESLEAYSDEFTTKGSASAVVYMNLKAPRSNVGNNPIIMMYARSPDHGETVDYNYPNNKIISGTDSVKTIFPVKGTITFSDDFKPLRYSTKSSSHTPELQYKGKGVCPYSYTQEQIASCFRISEDNPQVVEFELNEDWNHNLDISDYTSAHDADIALLFSFFFTVQIAGFKKEQDVGICIYSTNTLEMGQRYYESADDTNLCLPYVYIKWGCFSKDTLVSMADGSLMAVTEIQQGAQVMSENGEILTVRDVVSGDEEELYCIRTKGQKLIRLSATHPLKTTEGPVRAQDLRPGMALLCQDGTEDEILFNYTVPYNDKVYSLITEGKGQWLAANGIWAGDFDSQNNFVLSSKGEEPLSAEVQELTEEFDRLIEHLQK
ncbi:Hint domain-containing protein [Sediminispirochaeta bajacaliforniensis]|uniref:Hint domain-containing protein n=1 Tax=Sediminispirochaeta bajacaliforniensis TaxID=148 RepID=UPI00035EB0AD|nr:Hint domain-containing protein [Sediminispirochaeta bajacaliforniensis]